MNPTNFYSKKTPKNFESDAGVTLLEILVVLAIITMLAALVGPRLMNQLGKAKSQTASLQIDNLNSAVELYYIDVGTYPSSNEGLGALFKAPAGKDRWAGPYLKSDDALADPWDRPYLFESDGTDFEISTLGRDGETGGNGEDADLSSK